jgi:glycosyltransferase involved in cell wall biosynthesis
MFGHRAGRKAFDLARAGEVDVVHGFGASVLGYARNRQFTSVPLVLNPQGLEEFGATDPGRAKLKRMVYFPLRKAVQACARAADRIIATDHTLEPAVRAHLGVGADRVRTIPNGVDLESIDALTRSGEGLRIKGNAGFHTGDTVLLSVGRLEENKGFHVLVQALAALRSHGSLPIHDNWRWVLLGEGPFRPRIERAIREASLGDRVLIAGRVDERTLHAWYESATLFVHPTLYEGSSLVTLEAMAHRLAVIATRAGGLPDKVRDGVNGWLVEPGRPDALAAALSGALASASQLQTMGSASRTIVEREFAWPILAKMHLEMYRELVRVRS